MQTLTNPQDFTKQLKETRKIRYLGSNLLAEAAQIDINGHRGYQLKYFQFNGIKWVSFSIMQSICITELVSDFNEMTKIYN